MLQGVAGRLGNEMTLSAISGPARESCLSLDARESEDWVTFNIVLFCCDLQGNQQISKFDL